MIPHIKIVYSEAETDVLRGLPEHESRLAAI